MPDKTHGSGRTLDTKLERKKKVITLSEAGKMIAKCKILSVTGSQLFDAPMALIREAIRAGAKDLTLISNVVTGIAFDMLIAAECVDTCYVSYVGFEGLGLAPAFRKAGESKSIHIIEGDEPFVVLGVRAAASGLPFIAVPRHVYGATDIPKLNPHIRCIKDPYTGEDVYTIPPLKADVCIIHAQQADEYGNTQCWGGNRQEPDKAKAADFVIVSVEELVSVDETKKHPDKTTLPGFMVDAVVHVPFGAHPTGSSYCYTYDEEHLRTYLDLVGKGKAKIYLSQFVFGPKGHYEYLEKIGMEHMFDLRKVL
ncbi:MAG: CoA transferase subunit A [Deltaproteobacteria bacterium]|nr:CoA transferase subunit A [Deltaproteobacteria bacterium]